MIYVVKVNKTVNFSKINNTFKETNLFIVNFIAITVTTQYTLFRYIFILIFLSFIYNFSCLILFTTLYLNFLQKSHQKLQFTCRHHKLLLYEMILLADPKALNADHMPSKKVRVLTVLTFILFFLPVNQFLIRYLNETFSLALMFT